MEKERYKAIEGFEGAYSVSDIGKVYSHKSNKVMRYYLNNSGYACIKLRGGNKKHFLVHRLVAKAFCDGYEEGHVVNHIDANRLNNHASNLEWVTHKENIHDLMRRGKMNYTSAHAAARIACRKPVACFNPKTWEKVKEFPSLDDARVWLGKRSSSHISSCLSGRRKTAYGYKWKLI